VGTYTGSGSGGIYRFELDPASGAFTDPVLAGESENPSFLALHPGGHVLYAVNEFGTFGGAATGAVSAFAIDGATGILTGLGQQASGGADPCYVSVDRGGRNVLVASYTGGSVAVLPIGSDGRLQPASAVRRQVGSGPDKARQDGAHAHAIVLDTAERFALAADLGADQVFIYRFNGAAGTLEPNDPAAATLEPGSGPRHLAWHPSGKHLYAINELRSTVTAFRYDSARGALEPFQTLTTLPAGFSGPNTAAEVMVSPDGRFRLGCAHPGGARFDGWPNAQALRDRSLGALASRREPGLWFDRALPTRSIHRPSGAGSQADHGLEAVCVLFASPPR
jgi:6-phosphogluconolactonase